MANTTTIEDAAIKAWEKKPHYNMDDFCDGFNDGAKFGASLQTPSNEKYWRERCLASEELWEYTTYDSQNPCNDFQEYNFAHNQWSNLKSKTPIPIQTPCGWVKVEDGLPDDLESVLALHIEAGGICIANYDYESNTWQSETHPEAIEVLITHWMPLPTKPNL